jgi:hypothetical protein
MKEKKVDYGCALPLIYIGLFIVIYLVYQIARFFQRPDAIKSIVEFVEALGLCALMALLAVVCFALLSEVSDKLKSRLSRSSREYLVRCYAVELEKPPPGSLPTNLPEEPGQESAVPVHLLCSLTNYGLMLAAPLANSRWTWVQVENDHRFSQLSGSHSGPIILATGYFFLYYILYRQEGDLAFELSPAEKFGCSGELAPQPGNDQVKIIIVYTHFIEKGNLRQVIERDRPQKLKFVVLDKDGRDHPAATRELYQLIYKFVRAHDADNDDTWMYRSRPTIYW